MERRGVQLARAALAVDGHALAGRDHEVARRLARELHREPRLADTALAADEDDAAVALVGALEPGVERPQRVATADERRAIEIRVRRRHRRRARPAGDLSDAPRHVDRVADAIARPLRE